MWDEAQLSAVVSPVLTPSECPKFEREFAELGVLGFSVSDTAKSLRHLWAACKALTEQDVPHPQVR